MLRPTCTQYDNIVNRSLLTCYVVSSQIMFSLIKRYFQYQLFSHLSVHLTLSIIN